MALKGLQTSNFASMFLHSRHISVITNPEENFQKMEADRVK